MIRHFNIAGPCEARKHYMLPPPDRLRDLRPLIDREVYFVIRRARRRSSSSWRAASTPSAKRPNGRGYAGSSSPFNIKSASLRMRDFTADEVAALYEQNTAETGQVLSDEVKAGAFEMTRGQPWLVVNALARQLIEEEVPDPGSTVEMHHLEAVEEAVIYRHSEHFLRRQPYSEAAAQLIFMAFLQKITQPQDGNQVLARSAPLGPQASRLLSREARLFSFRAQRAHKQAYAILVMRAGLR